jgi:hypothetical protein
VPLTALLGITVDTSVLLRYHFWQQVYFKAIEPNFPSDSRERQGYVVGISEHVGHVLTWKVFDPVTNKVFHRSLCRFVRDSALNLRLHGGIGSEPFARHLIKSKTSEEHVYRELVNHERSLPEAGTQNGRENAPIEETIESLDDLVGKTFLVDQPDGQRSRARIVELIEKHDDQVQSCPDRVKFLYVMDHDGKDELMTSIR